MKKIVLFIVIAVIISQGCAKYYGAKDYASVKKIDAHVHIDSDDNVFEDQAAKDNFTLVTLNVDNGDSADLVRQYKFAFQSAKRNPGKVFYAPAFYFDTAGWGTEAWSERVIGQLGGRIKEGAVSVKIWKNIGMTLRDRKGKFIMADDPGLKKVFNFIKSRNLAVTGHLGEPRNCWLPLDEMTVNSDSSYFAQNPGYHMFLHPEYPSYNDQIAARDNLLKNNPDMVFIGCHLGSLEYNVDSLATRLDRFPGMAVDMAARICHLEFQSMKDIVKVRNFIIKYQDRLLYGTDLESTPGKNAERLRAEMHNTWLADWKYFATDEEMAAPQFRGKFTGLHLPKAVVDKIFWKNAVRWYKLPL